MIMYWRLCIYFWGSPSQVTLNWTSVLIFFVCVLIICGVWYYANITFFGGNGVGGFWLGSHVIHWFALKIRSNFVSLILANSYRLIWPCRFSIFCSNYFDKLWHSISVCIIKFGWKLCEKSYGNAPIYMSQFILKYLLLLKFLWKLDMVLNTLTQ